MIDCPNCNIKFTPDCHACPKCHDFVPPLSDRVGFLNQKAKEFADHNASREDVRDYLVASGLPDFDADDIVRNAFSATALENRLFAAKQITGGSFCILLGMIGVFLTPYAAALALMGLGAFSIGLYSLATGKS